MKAWAEAVDEDDGALDEDCVCRRIGSGRRPMRSCLGLSRPVEKWSIFAG
jgi:hypothetical protein